MTIPSEILSVPGADRTDGSDRDRRPTGPARAAGDAEAWRQLIERFEGRLLAFVDSRLRDRAASEDVVQETFIGFLTSLPHYDEKRDIEAYLFSIAAHKLTDHLRKQGRRPIDQFGSDDHGRPLEEVPGDGRAASSIARSGERRRAEERMLTDSLGQLVREWLRAATTTGSAAWSS